MTKGISGITNLYLYNRFIEDVNDDPSGNSSEQETIRYLIDQTNQLIEEKCGRSFGTATYKEWVKGDGTPYLVMHNYPITNIKLLSTNGVDLMTVSTSSSSSVPYATVSSNNSSLVLTSINTGGTETTNTFNYSTYANISTLVTAVDGISGWDAEVLSSQDDALTQLIRPLDSGWAVNEKIYLRGPYLGTDVRITYDSDSTIESIGGGSFCTDVFVWYTAGYTLPVCDGSGGTLTTEGNVPEGLTLIANKIIKDYLEQINEDTNMKSEKIGDYTYTRDGLTSAIDRYWKDLSQYSRKSV